MLDNAYGTGKTGQEKDLLEFFKKPRVWVRSALFTSHLIALASQGLEFIYYSQFSAGMLYKNNGFTR